MKVLENNSNAKGVTESQVMDVWFHLWVTSPLILSLQVKCPLQDSKIAREHLAVLQFLLCLYVTTVQ